MDVHDVIIISQKDQDLRAPVPEDYESLCRTCLLPYKSDKYKNIHEEEAQMVIRSLIEVYTFIKIPEVKDSLPQNICTKCLDFLVNVHMFRSRCRLNDDLLMKIQQKHAANSKNDGINYDSSDRGLNEETQALIDKINDERMDIYRCKDCQLVFDNSNDLKMHRFETKHSRRRASKCPHCSKMFNSAALKLHLRTHTKEKPYACNTCGATFTVKNNLRRHYKIHEEERAFTCDQCGKSFLRSESLANHMKSHEIKDDNNDLERTQECPVCKKCYQSVEQLRIHMRYHKKTFLCNNCGKVFSTKANLTTHLRVHTGERPFVCTVCKKGFTQSSSLKTHMGIHQGDKKFECEFCGRKFAVRGNLRVHQRIHTGETPHQCTICMKGFCTSSTLRKHLLKHAKDDVNEALHIQCMETQEESVENNYSSVVAVKIEEDNLVQHDAKEEPQEDEDILTETDVYVEEEYIEHEEFAGLEVGQEIQVIYNVEEGLQDIVYEEDDENIQYEVPEDQEEHVELCISDENDINSFKVQVIGQSN